MRRRTGYRRGLLNRVSGWNVPAGSPFTPSGGVPVHALGPAAAALGWPSPSDAQAIRRGLGANVRYATDNPSVRAYSLATATPLHRREDGRWLSRRQLNTAAFLRIVGRVPARDFRSGRQGDNKRGYRRFRPVASRNRRQRLGVRGKGASVIFSRSAEFDGQSRRLGGW
jgi:hypothetical protein